MDEGAINQVAMNLAERGRYGYQIAPERFITAEFLTTGYPVVYPIALSFLLFGKSLFTARFVMVLFIFFLSVSAYWYSKLLASREHTYSFFPLFSLFLLISFAPLYGHGKNVLGEVPGLAFFILSLLFLLVFERGNRIWWLPLLSGFFAGLSMATKPLYLILILPVSLFAVFLFKRTRFSFKEKWLFVLGIAMPLGWWVIAQSGDGSILDIFSYGNPNNASFTSLALGNSMRFFSELSPIYFLGLLLLWWVGVFLRKREGIHISTAESIALIFSLLNLLSFMFTRGFYRYFFPSEVFALLFLPYALHSVMRLKLNARYSLWSSILILIVIISLQSYQLFFYSWVSESRESTRAAALSRELGALPREQSIFFYHVPEAVLFLPHDNYYQYFRFADSVQRGSENIPLLARGVPYLVLVDQKFPVETVSLSAYHIRVKFDKYTLYEKK